MGERLVPAQPLAEVAARRLVDLKRRCSAAFVVLSLICALAVGAPQAALSQADSDESDVSPDEQEVDEETPSIELVPPRTPEDLDLGPGGSVPEALPAVDLSSPRLIDLIPSPELVHPALPTGIVVDPTSLGPIAVEINQARADRFDAEVRKQEATTQLDLASVRLAMVDGALDDAVAGSQSTSVDRVEATNDLSDYAVAAFLNSGEIGALALSNDLDSMSLITISSQTEEHLSMEMLAAVEDAATADAVMAQLRTDRLVHEAEINAATVAYETAVVDLADAEERITRLGPQLETSILELNVSGTDMPLVVLDAYYQAAENIRISRPSCRVSWHQLAGIGRVESVHGTFGGNVVGRDGRTSGEILGPVLDGDPWLAIPDTDGGLYDLDLEWDRAVGPMQFIPTSWELYGQDGNGDGIVDPHNLYDAAMAAANHLCGSAGNLDQRSNYQRALLGYNRSSSYGLLVMSYADSYFDALELGPNL